MKVSDSDRLALYAALLAALAPLKLKTTPPRRNGEAKPAAWPFATATWAKRLLDVAVYVLEKDSSKVSSEAPSAAPAEGASDAPF